MRARARPRRALIPRPAMMHLRLPDHLGVCEVDDRILMLDLRRDRYFELDPGTACAVRRWRDGADGRAKDSALARLLDRGMLIPAEPLRTSAPVPCAVPHRNLMNCPEPFRKAWPFLPEIAETLWRVRRRLKRHGLEGAVGHVRLHKSCAARTNPLPDLALFRTARLLIPIAPNCLTDSLALSAFLSRRDISFKLVFGVKLDPFAAHCWLQNDDAILNDAADSVAAFTPILVV